MKAIILAILISFVVCKPTQTLGFDQLFSTLTKGQKEGDFGFKLFNQIKDNILNGVSYEDITSHIEEIKVNLQQDDLNDKLHINGESMRINGHLQMVQQQLQKLESDQAYLETKLNVLNDQSENISDLFNQDDLAFQQRVGAQQAIIDALDDLIDRITGDLQNADVLIQNSNLFEQLKSIGKGKHVEVLAQITAHLDHDLVAQILDLFTALRESLVQSLNNEQAQEKDNIDLYQALRAKIGEYDLHNILQSLFLEVKTKYDEVSNEIEAKNDEEDNEGNALHLEEAEFVERQDLRHQSIQFTIDSQQIMAENQQNLDQLQTMLQDDIKA